MGDSPSQHQSDTEMAQGDEADAALANGAANSSGTSHSQEGSQGVASQLLTFSLHLPFTDEPCPSARAQSSSAAEDRHESASTSSRPEPPLAPVDGLPEGGISSAHTLGAAPSQSATSFSPWIRESFQPSPPNMAASRLRQRLARRERLKRTSPPVRRRSPLVPKRPRLSEEISGDRTFGRHSQWSNLLHSAQSSETISSGAGPSAGIERNATEPDSQQSSNGSATHAAVSRAERVMEAPSGLQRSSEPVPPPPYPTYQESSPVAEADSTTGRPSRATQRSQGMSAGQMSEQASSRVSSSPQSRSGWSSRWSRPLIPFHRRMDHSYLGYNRESPRSQLTVPPEVGFLPSRRQYSFLDMPSAGAAQAQQRPRSHSPRNTLDNFLALPDDDSPSGSALRDLPPFISDLPRVPRSTSGTGAPDASLGMPRNFHGRAEERSSQLGSPQASPATDAVLGVARRISNRTGPERYEALTEVAQYLARRRAARRNEGSNSGAANSSPGESSATPQVSRAYNQVYDDMVAQSRLNVDEFFSRLDNTLGSSSSSSSSGSGSGTDASGRGIPLIPRFLDFSDGEEVIMVHDSESESDSEGSPPPPVELPVRGARSGLHAPESGPPRPGGGPSHRTQVLTPPPDFSFPILNDYLQYESDEDLARRLQEEADRELAMSLSRNIGQMHDGEDDFLRGMNTFMTPGPRQPEAGPQVSSSAEATPPGGARAVPFDSRFPAQEHREREEMERMRVRREARYRLGQDRHITSPILLRLSPGSRQLVLRFHNARRIAAAERAAGDDPIRDSLDRLHGYELLLELTAEMGEIKPRGATSAEIGLIPEMKYQAWRETTRGVDAAPEKDECIICMVELEDSHDLRVLNCTHYFHKICIDKWLLSCATCPVCRDDIRGGKA